MTAGTSLLALVAAGIVAGAPAADPKLQFSRPGAEWTPHRTLIARFEARFVMPQGADRLAAYQRDYAGTVQNGRRVVLGLLTRGGRPGVRIISIHDLPEIEDGGCALIDVEYDVAADRLTPLRCHGMA